MPGLGYRAWCNRRNPMFGVPCHAPSQVIQLNHGRRAMLLDTCSHFGKIWNDAVVSHLKLIPERCGVFGRYCGCSAKYCQPNSAFRLFLVIPIVSFCRQTVCSVTWYMTGAVDAISDRQFTYLKRLEKGIVLGHFSGFSA